MNILLAKSININIYQCIHLVFCSIHLLFPFSQLLDVVKRFLAVLWASFCLVCLSVYLSSVWCPCIHGWIFAHQHSLFL